MGELLPALLPAHPSIILIVRFMPNMAYYGLGRTLYGAVYCVSGLGAYPRPVCPKQSTWGMGHAPPSVRLYQELWYGVFHLSFGGDPPDSISAYYIEDADG